MDRSMLDLRRAWSRFRPWSVHLPEPRESEGEGLVQANSSSNQIPSVYIHDWSLLKLYTPKEEALRVGDTTTRLESFDIVIIYPSLSMLKGLPFELLDAAFSPGLHTNIVSSQRMQLRPQCGSILNGLTTSRLDGQCSPTFDTPVGLLQGSPASPILFMLFIEPLFRFGPSLRRRGRYGYADDLCQAAASDSLDNNAAGSGCGSTGHSLSNPTPATWPLGRSAPPTASSPLGTLFAALPHVSCAKPSKRASSHSFATLPMPGGRVSRAPVDPSPSPIGFIPLAIC